MGTQGEHNTFGYPIRERSDVADNQAMAGHLTWASAIRDGRIRLDGPSQLVRAFPTWNARSSFAHIKPVALAAATG